MNYRAFKYNFTADPIDVPAVWAYSSDNSTIVYRPPNHSYFAWIDQKLI